MSEAVEKPGEKAARDNLHDVVKTVFARTFVEGGALARAVKAAEAEPDVVIHYGHAARTVLALEGLAKTAEAAAKDLRSALLASIVETGCPQVAEADLTVYTQREPAFLHIEDETRIPPDLWTKPKSEVDRRLVKDAINAGRDVPGALLQQRNSQRLVIRERK